MTSDKDFKRLVRGRMQKTGESYTAARSHLLRQPKPSPAPAPVDAVDTVPIDYAKLAGMSDSAIKAETGCGWEKWVYVLDKAKAYEWSHSRIAEYVHTKYKVGSWWRQAVTTGYERIKGLRVRGQLRSGVFQTSKSKTIAMPLGRLYRAFSQKAQRERWLPGVALTVRSSTRDKYMRMNWPDGTSVEIGFLSKGRGKSQVAIQHGKLADADSAVRMKAFWGERLEALAGLER